MRYRPSHTKSYYGNPNGTSRYGYGQNNTRTSTTLRTKETEKPAEDIMPKNDDYKKKIMTIHKHDDNIWKVKTYGNTIHHITGEKPKLGDMVDHEKHPPITEGIVIQMPRKLVKSPEKKGPTMVYNFRSNDTKRNMEAKLRLKKLKANEETDMTISESVQNILQTVIGGEPKDVKVAVETAINEKIAQALEERKTAIANQLVGLGESRDEDPSWANSASKTSRAKKLAMDKIKKQAKDEGVEFSDEDCELILEEILDELNKKTLGNYIKNATTDAARHRHLAIDSGNNRDIESSKYHTNKEFNRYHGIHRAVNRLTGQTKYKFKKEAIDHISAWFTEEELLPLIEDADSFGWEKRTGSSSSSTVANAFGTEHKGSGGTPSELSSAISKNKTSFNLGLKKKVTEASILGQGMSKEAKARDIEQSDKEYIEQKKFKDSYKAKHGNWPGWTKVKYTKGQTRVEESEQDPTNCVKPGFGDSNTKNKSPGKPTKPGFSPNTYTTANPLGYDKGSKQPGDIMGKTNEEVEQFNEMSPFAPKHAHRTGKKYGAQGGPKSDNPYPKSHILHTHWNQGHDEGAPKEKKNEETQLDEIKKVSKSTLAKKIKHGWHKGRGAFKSIADKAAAKYGSKEAGDRVAGAIMWHKYAHEDIQYTDEEIDYLITECWDAINEKLQELKESLQDEFEIELTDDEVDLILEDIIDPINEESPRGWQHVVKKLLQKKEGGSFSGNPWAIAWSMKNRGYKAHPDHQISRKSYDKWYQGTGKKIAGYA